MKKKYLEMLAVIVFILTVTSLIYWAYLYGKWVGMLRCVEPLEMCKEALDNCVAWGVP